MASSGRLIGRPMDKRREREYLRKVKLDMECGLLPDLRKVYTYRVYLLRDENPFHWLLVLTNNGKIFFSIELDNRYDHEGVYRVHPDTRTIDESKRDEMSYKGVVEDSGWALIYKALEIIRRFGPYSLLDNNCQTFCNSLLKEFGLEDGTEWTDGGVVAAGLAGAALFGGVGYVLYQAFKPQNSRHRNNQRY